MIRLLLTLLALLSGLCAPFSAVQARGLPGGEVTVAASAHPVRLTPARRSPAGPVVKPGTGAAPCTVVMRGPRDECAPPVQMRIDRAHE